jgi:hypothetical protein
MRRIILSVACLAAPHFSSHFRSSTVVFTGSRTRITLLEGMFVIVLVSLSLFMSSYILNLCALSFTVDVIYRVTTKLVASRMFLHP